MDIELSYSYEITRKDGRRTDDFPTSKLALARKVRGLTNYRLSDDRMTFYFSSTMDMMAELMQVNQECGRQYNIRASEKDSHGSQDITP